MRLTDEPPGPQWAHKAAKPLAFQGAAKAGELKGFHKSHDRRRTATKAAATQTLAEGVGLEGEPFWHGTSEGQKAAAVGASYTCVRDPVSGHWT